MSAKKPKLTDQEVKAIVTDPLPGSDKQTSTKRGFAKLKAALVEKQEDPTRKRFTVNLDTDLIEWARQAVVFTPGLSLSGLVERALTSELERMVKSRGKAFPTTTFTPKKGRPVVLKGD